METGRFVIYEPPCFLFDASPVSRSRAKRNRLDRFKDAKLDFEGLEYPELKLIPTNMNDKVAAMYRHVLTGAEEGK